MERTTSRPPPGGGADWAMFFAPVAVTAVVILGALIFVWSSEPEPVDRPEVERVDLSELAPVPESTRLSAVPTTRQLGGGSEDEPTRSVRAPRLGRQLIATSSEGAPVAEVEEDYDDEEDFVDMTSDREYTPEQRREAKAGLVDAVRKVSFMAPMIERAEAAASEAPTESAVEEDAPPNQESPAQSGAAGARFQ